MNHKKRLFLILWLAGMAGAVSLLWIDVPTLVANLPLPPGTEVPPFTPVIRALTVLQPALLMTLAVLIGVALASRVGLSSPVAEAIAVGAILLSALLFAAGHLPVALLLLPRPTPAYVTFVIVANSIFGVIAAFLFWRKGLESAVIAHMVTHAVLLLASYLGVYF